jgi:ADP-ribose pyrophosphatase YjhB (NUDIX family)
MAEETGVKTDSGHDIYRVKRDVNGNSRSVVHFFAFLVDADAELEFEDQYNAAKRRANSIGGRVYRGKDFGGGFVFQANPKQLSRDINEFMASR